MKKMTKSIVLTLLTFVIGLFSVKAAVTVTTDANGKVTNTGTLSITGVQSTDAFNAYKIVDVKYDTTTNTISYAFTDSFAPYAATKSVTVDDYMNLTSGSTTSGSTQTNSTLDALVSGYVSYIKTNNIAGSPMTVENTTASAVLPAGAYLVLPSSTDKVYAVMVGNILLEAGANNTWELSEDSIKAKVSNVSINKVVKGKTANESYNIGDTITFEVTSSIPTYPTNATNKVVIIKDTLSNGLNFDSTVGSVVVYDGTTALTNTNGVLTNASNQEVGTVALSGKDLTVTLDSDKLANTTVKVEYNVKLNSNAVLGSSGNSNSASLEYSNEPYSTGTTTTTTTSKITTFGIRINKTNNSNAPLANVSFKVCSDSACNNVIDTITTNGSGVAEYKGLASGTYYLKESSVPAGYKIKTEIISITIDTTKDYTPINITNDRLLLSLPGTGGNGIYIYIGAGAVVLLGAIVGLVAINKKKNKKENIEE